MPASSARQQVAKGTPSPPNNRTRLNKVVQWVEKHKHIRLTTDAVFDETRSQDNSIVYHRAMYRVNGEPCKTSTWDHHSKRSAEEEAAGFAVRKIMDQYNVPPWF